MNNKVFVCCSFQNMFLTLHSANKYKVFSGRYWSKIQSPICLLKLVVAKLRDLLVKPLVKFIPKGLGISNIF